MSSTASGLFKAVRGHSGLIVGTVYCVLAHEIMRCNDNIVSFVGMICNSE